MTTPASVVAISDPRWVSLVSHRDDATPFHHPAWAGMLAECYGYHPLAVCDEDSAGNLTAGVPVLEVRLPGRHRRWVALPFTDYCPPVGRVDEDFTAALDAARRQAGIRRFDLHADLGGPGAQQGAQFLFHRLPLQQDSERVLTSVLPARLRREIRRSQRSGLTVHEGAAEADLSEEFYGLHVRTRRRLGVPVQPRRYFRLLWRRVLSRRLGYLLLARCGETTVAGGVFLSWHGTVVYKYGASDPGYWRLRPNHLVLWEAVRRSCQEGASTFDFGRTGLRDEGLRDFKQRWGGRESRESYTVLADRTCRPSGHAVPPLARHALRRAPEAAVRAVGEMLYRYTA